MPPSLSIRPATSQLTPLRCALCHDVLVRVERACPSCGALLHAECSTSGCPTFGCAEAPRRRIRRRMRGRRVAALRPRVALWALIALAAASGGYWLALPNEDELSLIVRGQEERDERLVARRRALERREPRSRGALRR